MKNTSSNNVLRITIIAGIILFALTIFVLTIFYFADISGKRLQRQEENFARALREYDLSFSFITGGDINYEKLTQELNRLEKMTISVESWLSVLKRRRALMHQYPESASAYYRSLDNALEKYPMAPPIIALAVERLVKGAAITPENEIKIREWLPSFININYNNLLLSLHVLLGDFRNIERAHNIPDYLISDGTETVTINLILLKLLKNDLTGAFSSVQSMLLTLAPSDEGLRFIAEFFYDYGDLERSAEIFTRINDEKALSRASDALYLAGFTEQAKIFWLLLSRTESSPNIIFNNNLQSTENLFREKSLYNLGMTSDDKEESYSYFDKLLNINTDNISIYRQFGLIRFSRLMELAEAVETLEKTKGLSPEGYPYIDLEILRRYSSRWEIKRQFAESWLLIDRHPEDDDLYRWASWLFLFQRNYSEHQILLDRIERLKFKSQDSNYFWPDVNRAIQLMSHGELEKAENLLSQIPQEKAGWVVFANLGRIAEANRSYSQAIVQYEAALEKSPSFKNAAKLQIRIAMCLITLQRTREARIALERALELEPGNITARMELDRIINSYLD